MKKMIFLVACFTASTMIFAQQHKKGNWKAPESVRTSYQNDYPDYKDAHTTWDMQNNQWHTRYKDKDHGNRYVDVYYDKNGHRARSRSMWDRNDLPDAVKNRVSRKYHVHNYKAYRIERPDKGVVFQITWGSKRVYVNETGKEVRY